MARLYDKNVSPSSRRYALGARGSVTPEDSNSLPFIDRSVRAAADSSGRLLFVAAALLLAFASHAQAGQAAGARQRITTASSVRVRSAPDTASEEVGRLQLGVIVEELERSQEKAKVGAS